MKTVLIIAPLSSLSKRTRMKKIAHIFHDHGYDILHLGWERIAGESKERLGFDISKRILIHGGGYSNKKARYLYIIWLIKVFFFLFINGKNFSVIYCLGFESAFPAMLINFLNQKKIIFDDADRLLLILSFPNILKNFIEKIELWVSSNVYIHIIPNQERYPYKNNKMVVIKNTPDENEFKQAINLEINRKTDNLTVYINGWLTDLRGIPIFYQVAQNLTQEKVTFLVAGRSGCIEADELKRLPNVIDLGTLSNSEALAYYKISDLVVTYYDPKMRINQFAEANKWGDAIFFEVPVLVNAEVKTAKFLIDAGACFTFPYHDIDAVSSFLKTISNNKTILSPKRENLKQLQSNFPFFDKAVIQNLKDIL